MRFQAQCIGASTRRFIVSHMQVRQVTQNLKEEGHGRNVHYWQGMAFQALQEAAECYITLFFEECDQLSNYCKRRTVMARDAIMVRTLRERHGVL